MRIPVVGASTGLLFALMLAGCAATRREPGPEVAPQPRAQPVQRYRPTDRSVRQIREQNAATAVPLDFAQRLDHAHDRIYSWMQGAVEATDRRLAPRDRELQPVPAAPFRIGLTLQAIDRDGNARIGVDGDLELALQLPNTERRLRVFITSDDPDESPRDTRHRSFVSAGLRRELARNLDLDLGLRLDVPPVAFTSLKWSQEIALGGISFYPFAKLFLESGAGFGASAAATFDRWSGRTLLRSSTYGRWTADGDRKDWTQSLVFARAHELIVPDRYGSYLRANDIGRGWGLRVQATGEDSRRVSFYEAGFFLRQRTSTRWLYGYVEPLVRWERARGWNADPGVRLGFEALFWDLARPARAR